RRLVALDLETGLVPGQVPAQADARVPGAGVANARERTASGGSRLQHEHLAADARLQHVREAGQTRDSIRYLDGRRLFRAVQRAQLAYDRLVDRGRGPDERQRFDLRPVIDAAVA